jgi:hypothetical protein
MKKTLLDELCKILGWQGGTIHDAIREVNKLKAQNENLKCCGNCKFRESYLSDNNDLVEFCSCTRNKFKSSSMCETWEFDSIEKKYRL